MQTFGSIVRRYRHWLILPLVATLIYMGLNLGQYLYYRSDRHRRSLEADLTRFFGLPFEVAGVEPLSMLSHDLILHQVRVWLPEKRDLIFEAPEVIWLPAGGGSRDRAEVVLKQAVWTVGSEAWEADDYTRVLRASLHHDYSEYRLGTVRLNGSELRWPRKDIQLRAEGVEGRLDFDEDGVGHGLFTATSLNGQPVSEPIQITADVDPLAEKLLPRAELIVPPLSVQALGLAPLTGAPLTAGTVTGKLVLIQSGDHEEFRFQGEVRDVLLQEVTTRLPGGALTGRVDLHINEAVIRDRQLRALALHGRAREVAMDPLLARWNLSALGGRLELEVHQAAWNDDRLQRLEVSGTWEGASLEALSLAILRRPGLGGQLRVRLDRLVWADGIPVSGEADCEALPPAAGPAFMERSLLIELLEEMGIRDFPGHLLPERIPFVHMGLRLTLADQRLRITSGRGPAGPALLTVRLFGRDTPLLSDLYLEWDLGDLHARLGPLAEQWRSQLHERIRRHLQPATGPASPP